MTQTTKQFQPTMSIYIPHVFENITKEHIYYVFEILRIGRISHIDFIMKTSKNKPYNCAYIHFEFWYNNIANINLQEKIRNPEKEARIVYDDPWFWLILENTASKTVEGERKPCINLEYFGLSNKKTETVDEPLKTVDETFEKVNEILEPVDEILESVDETFEKVNEILESDVQNMEEIQHYLEYCDFENEQEIMEDDVYENPSFDYVDSRYAFMLECQIYNLRVELEYIKRHSQYPQFIGGCMM